MGLRAALYPDQPDAEFHPHRGELQVHRQEIYPVFLPDDRGIGPDHRLHPQLCGDHGHVVGERVRRAVQRPCHDHLPDGRGHGGGDGLHRHLPFGEDGHRFVELYLYGKRGDTGRSGGTVRMGQGAVLHHLPVHLHPGAPRAAQALPEADPADRHEEAGRGL